MADSPIPGQGVTVQQLFKNNTFALDYYQREYTWTRDEVRTLIEDLSHRFMTQWDPLHEREQVDDYAPYFLGPFVYHEHGGRTFLVDGQQRITTLHLLLIYLRQLLADQEEDVDVSAVEELIYTARHGKRNFAVDASEEPARAQLLNALVKDWNGLTGFLLPDDSHVSVRNLHDRSREIDEDFPEILRGEALVFFVEWLLSRVCLVGIRALDQENGREIFVSMNDRGLRPSPVDLLKGHLFQQLNQNARAELGKAWADMLARLSAAGADAHEANTPSTYVRSFLLAQYARFDELSQDAVEIERAFHEWVLSNKAHLRLDHPAGARELITRLTEVAKRYCTALRASREFRPELAAVFFNGHNGIDNQFTLLLAIASPEDPDRIFVEKCAMVATFLDLVYVRRCVNNLPVQRRDLDEVINGLIPVLRKCRTTDDIATILGREIALLEHDFRELKSFGLRANNRRLVRYLLARMTAHVQRECGGGYEEADYLQGPLNYEIEHIWADHFERYKPLVKTGANFDYWRNRLGALLILPKSVNASFRDDPYEQKIEHYRAQNRLAASLHPKSRERNPQFTKYLKAAGLDKAFHPCPMFGMQEIEHRQELYQRLCEEIWNPRKLGFTLPKIPPSHEQVVRRRTRAHYGIELVDLITAGLMPPGAKIFRKLKGDTYFATVEESGVIRLDTGEPFPSLSAAGAAISRTKACAGWDVWRIEHDGATVPLKNLRNEAIRLGLSDARS
ncbi:Protein of unknown function [Streptosporangium subroseum]|uniref:DUF262 domain-containing protein n=1 Tax=Streptosporangium subroseum TaxID=106412 RepID=A0A239JKY7_9ACTN|nr:DUF262 domain-containing protein [Streptosporangium subroseum]SNT06232.1 Protein of unknown function [Streptosporangium subroseum]